MFTLIRCSPGDWYSGDWGLEFLLVVTLGVALASSAAWLISRRLAGKAALRHLVLFSALICCLASPVMAWFCAAAGLTLVTIPIFPGPNFPGPNFPGEQGRTASGVTQIETDPIGIPPRQSTDPPPVVAGLPLPRSNTPIDQSADVAVASAANQRPATQMLSAPDVQRIGNPAGTLVSFRGIATGAMFVWAAGALLMLARLARDCGRVVQLRRSSRPFQNECLQTFLQEIGAKLEMRQVPLLLVSSRTVIPLAVGFGRPAVILPERLFGAVNDNELRDVLVHEVAHLRRGDQRIVLLQELAGALYWPIVSVHGLNRELQRAREELSDNVVIAGRNAISYCETLLHVAELLVKARPMGAAVGIIGGQGELERRIAGLIDPRRNTMTTTGRKAACIVMFLFIAGSAIASATRFAASAAMAKIEDGRSRIEDREVASVSKNLACCPEPVPVFQQSASAAGTSPEAVADDASPAPEDGPQRPINPPVVTTTTGTKIPAVWEREKAPPKIDLERKVVLHGKILGQEDRPIAGARLYVSADDWTDPVELGTSDVNGSYRLAVPEKSFRRYMDGTHTKDVRAWLIAIAKGHGPVWANLPAVEREGWQVMKPEYAQDFHLAADFPIAGRIVDAGGKPVAGAVIAVGSIDDLADLRWQKMHPTIKIGNPDLKSRPESDPNDKETPLHRTAWKMMPSATTDSEGRFTIAGVGRDRAIKLVVTGPGIRSTNVSVVTRDDPPRKGAPQEDAGVLLFGPSPTIKVDPARTVAGIVRDAKTGEPIRDVRVVAGGLSDYTDRHGRYRIVEEGPGALWAYAMPRDHDRYLSAVRQFDVAKGLEIVADIDLPPGVVVTGRVLESGTDRPIVSAPRYTCHAPWPGAVVAGLVYYFPLSTNAALRGTPTGLYFEGGPTREANYHTSAWIGAEGQYRIAVPPGPGVLLVQSAPGLPMFGEMGVWKESDGFHRLFPYVTLATRAKDDDAAEGDAQNLRGFTGPIRLANYHTYRVINPPADATTLALDLSVPRAPSRVLRFVGPDGRAIRGVTVKGLLAPPQAMTVVLDGSEAEILALEPGKTREVIATSNDGKYTAKTIVSADDPQPKTVRLEPAGIR